mgnify:CR=1 FL=1
MSSCFSASDLLLLLLCRDSIALDGCYKYGCFERRKDMDGYSGYSVSLETANWSLRGHEILEH